MREPADAVRLVRVASSTEQPFSRQHQRISIRVVVPSRGTYNPSPSEEAHWNPAFTLRGRNPQAVAGLAHSTDALRVNAGFRPRRGPSCTVWSGRQCRPGGRSQQAVPPWSSQPAPCLGCHDRPVSRSTGQHPRTCGPTERRWATAPASAPSSSRASARTERRAGSSSPWGRSLSR